MPANFNQPYMASVPTASFVSDVQNQRPPAAGIIGNAAMDSTFEAGVGRMASPEPPVWQQDACSPFGFLPTASSSSGPGWPGSKTAGTALHLQRMASFI